MPWLYPEAQLTTLSYWRRLQRDWSSFLIGAKEIKNSMVNSNRPSGGKDVRGRLLRIFCLGFELAVVVGGVIGSGIMRNPLVVAAGFRDAKIIVLAWLAGGIFVVIEAMPTVELGAAIPQSGGPYPLAVRAIGRFPRFFCGLGISLKPQCEEVSNA